MFHILVVEDDAKLRSLFCTVLTNNGYLALPAESGEKALSLLDSEYVDLIISDIMMPGMDGYELIEHLRTSGFTMPILIITAKERFEDKQRGFQASDCLPKYDARLRCTDGHGQRAGDASAAERILSSI